MTYIFKPNQFIKIHGTGNNFIVLQHNNQSTQQIKALAIKVCEPNFSIGADGILLICKSENPLAKYHMKIFNRDGSYAEMCGNGLRCFCACLRELGMEKQDKFQVSTDAGIKNIQIYKKDNIYRVKIALGQYNVISQIQNMKQHLKDIISDMQFISAHFLVFNIPHYVIHLQQMPSSQRIIEIGKTLQKHINSNINFIKLQKQENKHEQLHLRTFQRGAGLTLACGTGACASFLVGVNNGLCQRQVKVRTQGGILIISEQEGKVIMDGPAEFICRGIYY